MSTEIQFKRPHNDNIADAVNGSKRLCIDKKSSVHDEIGMKTNSCKILIKNQRSPRGQRKLYHCSYESCTKFFKHPTHLIDHQRTHTGEKPYICNYEACNKRFARSGHLTLHKRIHTGEKPYICDHSGCNKRFAVSSNLAKHKKIHTEKMYSCEYCAKAFATTESLNVHKRKHTGEKPYVCDYDGCTKMFSQFSNLVSHKRIHTGEKRYICNNDQCGKSFLSSQSWIVHQRKHTGLKPFVCDFADCMKAFTISGNLVRHKRTHTGEKPHFCEHCGYRTIDMSHLRRHVNGHEKQKSYLFACEMQDGGTQPWSEGFIRCEIRTRTEQHMDYHVQRNHTVEGIARKLESEYKLALFFNAKQVKYDRDWTNRINFKTCKFISGDHASARPDFFLPSESARLNAVVLVGNDEMQHRRYACEFERVFNIANALEQTKEFHSVPIIYFRFNPHFYKRGNVFYDHPLSQAHEILWHTVQNFQPSQVKPGVNLVYIHYDCDDKGMLTLFSEEEEEANDFTKLFQDCVRLIV